MAPGVITRLDELEALSDCRDLPRLSLLASRQRRNGYSQRRCSEVMDKCIEMSAQLGRSHGSRLRTSERDVGRGRSATGAPFASHRHQNPRSGAAFAYLCQLSCVPAPIIWEAGNILSEPIDDRQTNETSAQPRNTPPLAEGIQGHAAGDAVACW